VIAPLALVAALAVAPPPVVTHGAGTTVIAQQDPSVVLSGTMLFVRAGLDRQGFSQNGLAALTAQTILETPSTGGLPLREAIAAGGGSIDRQVDDGDVRFYVEGLAGDEGALVDAFAAALRAPDFSAATVARARADLQADAAGASGLSVGITMLQGTPTAGTAVSLAQFVPDDVRAFYAANYRRGDSMVSVVGPDVASAGYDRIASALAPGSSAPAYKALPALKGHSHQIVAYRDIAVPWLVARYAAPSYDDKDFGAMLVLSSFVDKTLDVLGQVPSLISRTSASGAVGSIYAFDDARPSLTVYLYGGLGEPTQTFSAALAVFKMAGGAQIEGSLDELKAQARGRFARDASSLEDRAWLAGVFAREGSADYLNRTFAAIDAVKAADIKRVAHRYMGDPTIALVLPRQGS